MIIALQWPDSIKTGGNSLGLAENTARFDGCQKGKLTFYVVLCLPSFDHTEYVLCRHQRTNYPFIAHFVTSDGNDDNFINYPTKGASIYDVRTKGGGELAQKKM